MLRPAIYLDYAATTPVDPVVVAAMLEMLTDPMAFANPSSLQHSFGKAAIAKVESARSQLACALEVPADTIIWTSGATEANNLALKGFAYANQQRGKHIISVKTEHKSVLACLSELAKQGFSITLLDVDVNGLIDLNQLRQAFKPETILVSVMAVNNETGVIQDIAAIAELTHAHGARLHVDAVQALGRIPFASVTQHADLISLTAHKLYGPKGIGALLVRDDPRLKLVPLMHGANQEQGLRAGTLAPHQSMGFAVAAELAVTNLAHNTAVMIELQQHLLALLTAIPAVYLHSSAAMRVPHIVNVGITHRDGPLLVQRFNERIAASTGSACNVNTKQPSHVLLAQGVPMALAQASLRFSLGKMTTLSEITEAVDHLRSLLVS